eukprot:scaffold231172_cov48-Attheya_sp.AAC.2
MASPCWSRNNNTIVHEVVYRSDSISRIGFIHRMYGMVMGSPTKNQSIGLRWIHRRTRVCRLAVTRENAYNM